MTIEKLKFELAKCCKLKLKSFTAGKTKFDAYAVEDLDKLFDQLVEQTSDHPDILDERLPYWAEVWPSSLVLAEYLQSADWISTEMSILELGCGPGLAGLGALNFTKNITVSDYQTEALQLAELNWLHNIGTSPEKLLLDWREPQDLQFDVLLAADVAYEKRFFEPLINTFAAMTKKGGCVVLTEPRRGIAAEFFKLLNAQGWEIEKSSFAKNNIDIYRILIK